MHNSSTRVAFFLGFVGGSFLTLTAVAVISWVRTSVGMRAADHAQAAQIAQFVSAPLVPLDHTDETPSAAQLRARIQQLIEHSESLAHANLELSPIAAEYTDCLLAAKELAEVTPDVAPMLREGLGVLTASREDDGVLVLVGLLGMAMEYDKLQAPLAEARALHARVVACRLRLNDVVNRLAQTASEAVKIEMNFEESGFGSLTPQDRFVMKNVSGKVLTNPIVITELDGASGETFSNCYFIQRWEPGQILAAICPSDGNRRETVANVKFARCRVVASEGASVELELAR